MARQYAGHVHEVHPEVSFTVLSGRPLACKRTWNGLYERIAILTQEGIEIPTVLGGNEGRIPPDDRLDAAVVALTAQHVADGVDLDAATNGVLVSRAIAWPIRYVAGYEVIDDRVAGAPLGVTW